VKSGLISDDESTLHGFAEANITRDEDADRRAEQLERQNRSRVKPETVTRDKPPTSAPVTRDKSVTSDSGLKTSGLKTQDSLAQSARALPLVAHLYGAWRAAFGSVPGVGSAGAVSECIRREGSHPRQVHAHAERVALVVGAAEAEPDPAAWLDRTIAGFAADSYVKSKGAGFELYAAAPGKYLKKPIAHPSATSDFTHADPTGDF
jgi:hypothetical protein